MDVVVHKGDRLAVLDWKSDSVGTAAAEAGQPPSATGCRRRPIGRR
jgi:ATP-dependent exoDNAse (exonuclease V) beta subunit